ncbi:MAG: hypothetical protein RBT47_11025 [Anaerolineae bacterium]|jgi:tetratricopeptide (TPR) repeat protein|nr:hypothetical protein [Anaerolineae bacterium]
MELIPANSITFEVAHIMAQRCDCGSSYAIHSQRLMEINGWPVDCIIVRCQRCQEERLFFFDIHTFYGREEAESTFAATQNALQTALEALHDHRWDEAETLLRRAVDPLEGEPAFGWGHYHLGITLLKQEHYEEGLAHIRKAIDLVPSEAEFYNGLSKALVLLGDENEAARAGAIYHEMDHKAQQAALDTSHT